MLLGIIILAIGVLSLISVINPEFVINYSLIWPTALILLCLYSIFKNKRIDMVPAIGLFVGTLIFGVNASFWNEDIYQLIVPGVLIIIGVSIMISSIRFKKKKKVKETTTKDAVLTYNGVFSGIEEKVIEKNFQGANIYAVFGGVDLDLRNVEIKDDVVMNVYSIFGGTTLLVPKDYNIKINSTAILGGNENKVNNEYNEKQKTIYINCVSIFGGCEIK